MLQSDGGFVSGVDKVAARARTKPGRLYHKFDSLCALATSKGGRLLLVQHKNLNHVFYAICFHPNHNLYNETLNMYESRWYAVSDTYGKEVDAEAVAKSSSSETTPWKHMSAIHFNFNLDSPKQISKNWNIGEIIYLFLVHEAALATSRSFLIPHG